MTRREELHKMAEELRNNPPAKFNFPGLHDLDDDTTTEEFFIVRNHKKIHFYMIRGKKIKEKVPYVINVHGGGMVRSHAERDLLFCKRMALATGFAVISLDYHLAPEYAYPYALDELETLIRYLAETGEQNQLKSKEYALCGQSSGGNLCFGVSQRLKNTAYRPLGLIGCYSVQDMATNPDNKPDECSQQRRDRYKFYFECYLNESNPENYDISPIRLPIEELRDLPQTMIFEGGLDELRTENFNMFCNLYQANVKTSFHFYPQSGHGFIINQEGEWKEAQHQLFEGVKDILGNPGIFQG